MAGKRAIRELQKACRSGLPVALFLDYDGTLVPFQKKPDQALLSPEIRSVLRKLSRTPNLFLAFVTGRAIADIRKKIGIKNVGYGACHGFEIRLNGRKWIHPDCAILPRQLAGIFSLLKNALADVPGILIQNKRFCISVHYRGVNGKHIPEIKKTVMEILLPYSKTFMLAGGKKHFEIRPAVRWGKGDAILKMIKLKKFRTQPIVVFAGDDETDEDAFKTLRNLGLTIRIGKKKKTFAKYFLKNVEELEIFLRGCAGLER